MLSEVCCNYFEKCPVKSVLIFHTGKSPVIVYESADLDSAVESVVDAIWFNQGQVRDH